MSYNFNQLKLNYQIKLKQQLLSDILAWDNEFYINYDRSQFIVVKKRNRTVISEYGTITYSRRIYKNKTTNQCICFTDLHFGIDKKQRIMNDLKKIVVRQIATAKTMQDIKDTIPNAPISLVSISRILNQKIISNHYKKKIILKEQQILYINTDDCFPNLKKNGKKIKYRVRVVTFNTGMILFNKRKKLNQKRYAYIITQQNQNINPIAFADFIKTKINEFYEVKHPKLILGGDGSSWINGTAKRLRAEYIADSYHAVKALWKIFVAGKGKKKVAANWDKYFQAKTFLTAGNYHQLIKILVDNHVDSDIINYFKRSKQGIINQSANWNIGVSAESDIFHLVKSMCTGARILSDNHFKNKLIVRTQKLNAKV